MLTVKTEKSEQIEHISSRQRWKTLQMNWTWGVEKKKWKLHPDSKLEQLSEPLAEMWTPAVIRGFGGEKVFILICLDDAKTIPRENGTYKMKIHETVIFVDQKWSNTENFIWFNLIYIWSRVKRSNMWRCYTHNEVYVTVKSYVIYKHKIPYVY